MGTKTLLAICFFSMSCFAQSALPPVGSTAPRVELSNLLQAPSDTPRSSAAFKGKSVVLEFWATWCGGCVAEIPHLNELANQFTDRPVVFLSITDEEPVVVNHFCNGGRCEDGSVSMPTETLFKDMGLSASRKQS